MEIRTVKIILKNIQERYDTVPLFVDEQTLEEVTNICQRYAADGWIPMALVQRLVELTEETALKMNPTQDDTDEMGKRHRGFYKAF